MSPASASRSTPAESVARSRRVAFEVIRRTFEDAAWTDRAFRATAERYGLEGRERAQAQRLSYGSVQMRATTDHLISRLSSRGIDDLDPPLLAALRLGTYELLFSGAAAPHAVVNESVELAKRAGRGPSRLANAVLRRVVREGPGMLNALTDEAPHAAAVKHSHPEWIARLWWDELGPEAARRLMAADNVPAETALRVNPLRSSREGAIEQLEAGGARVVTPGKGSTNRPSELLSAPEILTIDGRTGDGAPELIEAGWLVPQSRASAAAVALLDPQPGERILDLCAGPGIKTAQIAARVMPSGAAAGGVADPGGAGEVHAVEIDPRRAAEARELCERAGVMNVRFQVADAAEAELDSGYDRVLVDPPCSGLGTLAQRPDARWRRSHADPERLGNLQRRILRRGLDALRPGGVLAYSTCTVSRAESETVVLAELDADAAFEPVDLSATHPELASPHDRRFLQTRPDLDGTAGFFMALLRRRAGGG